MIRNIGSFSELEMLEICVQVNCEENTPENPLKGRETQNVKNYNIAGSSRTIPTTSFPQKGKNIIVRMKKTMNEKMEVLPSVQNQV